MVSTKHNNLTNWKAGFFSKTRVTFQPSFQGFPHKNLREKLSVKRLRDLPVFPRFFDEVYDAVEVQ